MITQGSRCGLLIPNAGEDSPSVAITGTVQ